MKTVYRADALTHIFIGSDNVADDYQLKSNETFDNPSGKLEPVKLKSTGWVAATAVEHEAYVKQRQADYLANNPMPAQQPDKGTEALGALGKQVGQLVIDNQKNTKAVQALGAQIAGLIAKDNANGGK